MAGPLPIRLSPLGCRARPSSARVLNHVRDGAGGLEGIDGFCIATAAHRAHRDLVSLSLVAPVASARQIHRVNDLDALVGRLEAEGVTFVSSGLVTLKHGGRAAAIRDPDGHMIVLMG